MTSPRASKSRTLAQPRKLAIVALVLAALTAAHTGHAQKSRVVVGAAKLLGGERAIARLLGREVLAGEGRLGATAINAELSALQAGRGAAISRAGTPRNLLLADIARGESFLDVTGRNFLTPALSDELKVSESWLSKVSGGREAVFVTKVDDAVVVSSGGKEFEFVAHDASRLYRDARPYVIHPDVVQSKEWRWMAEALQSTDTKVSIEWVDRFGGRQIVDCRWARNSANLLFEHSPNLYVAADSALGQNILRRSVRTTYAEARLRLLQGTPETNARAFRFEDLQWLNFHTAGDIRPLARTFQRSQTVSMPILADGQAANLARYMGSLKGVKGKLVLVTGHREGSDFVSRLGGKEQFRVPIEQVVSALREAGADVFVVGCEVAEVVGMGPLKAVTPELIAQGIARARHAKNVFQFQKLFASLEMPVVAVDIAAPAAQTGKMSVRTGVVLGVAGSLAGASSASAPTPGPLEDAKSTPSEPPKRVSVDPLPALSGTVPLPRPLRLGSPTSPTPKSGGWGCRIRRGHSRGDLAIPALAGSVYLLRRRRRSKER